MDKFCLNIAGHIICFKRGDDAPGFVPAKNLNEFIADSSEEGITITVFNKQAPESGSETELFSAPFMEEEKDGTLVKKSDRFWSVHQADEKKAIRVYHPVTGNLESSLIMKPRSADWELYSSSDSVCCNPFSYPLDGLILYYALMPQPARENQPPSGPGKSVLIHASAIEYENQGYLFTGVSGKGKTTMSEIWKEAGANIIHDDLIIISQGDDDSVIVSSTPLNGNEYARKTDLNAIFLIEHSRENLISEVKGAEAISYVMSNTIQHNYSQEIIENHLDIITKILAAVPVYKLGFSPDLKIVDAINALLNGKPGKPLLVNDTDQSESEFAVETVLSVLESGNKIELGASGFSMFPSLRPGDRILVKPLSEVELPEKGSVVICLEDMEAQKDDLTKSKEVYQLEKALVMHRLIDIRKIEGIDVFITRGDSMDQADKPWSRSQLIGIAVSYKRKGKEYPVRTFIPGSLRYKFNQSLLLLSMNTFYRDSL